MQVRRAIPSDIPQIRKLGKQAATAAHWTAEQYETMFSPEALERVALVACDDSGEATMHGFLIGRCLSEEWEIENVVVDADRRRQGIARTLIEELTGAAGSAGALSVILEVRESNLPAVRLYENMGFKEDGRRRDYYQNPAEDALLYRLTLHFCDKIP